MKLAASEGYEITKDKADAYLAEMDDLELGRNVSSILLIGVEQAPLDESNVINMDARSVSHDYLMTCTIQFSYITGDRYIAASGIFIVRKEVGDGNTRLFLDMLFDDSKSCVNHINHILA